MKNITTYIAIVVGASLIAGCNEKEGAKDTSAKSEQQAKEPKNIMRMDPPGPAPDPSEYKKGTF